MSTSTLIAFNHGGNLNIMLPVSDSGLTLSQIMSKDIPPDATDIRVLDSFSIFPADNMFRGSWKLSGNNIVEDLEEARLISHDFRRLKRAVEFAPWDIKVTIPMYATAAEAERQLIRNRYAQIQIDLDAATDVQTLRTIVLGFQ